MKLPANFDFTQSNLQDYHDCHYRFYLRYVKRIKWPALIVDDAAEFERRRRSGARFHQLVQQYLLGLSEKRLTQFAGADPDPEVSTWWESFLTTVPPLLKGKRFVEITLSGNLKDHRLLAKYDLILIHDSGKLSIFDWKTSHSNPKRTWLEEKIQTRLYRFLLVRASKVLTQGNNADPSAVQMIYWFASHPKNPITLPYNEIHFQADRVYFQNLIAEILTRKEDAFLRTEDLKHCRYCVYRSHCNRGTAAGDINGFEEFDLEPDDFEPELEFEEIPEIEF